MKGILVVLISCLCVTAQEQSITLNGTELKLGMQRAEVIERLQAQNTISKIDTSHWCAKPKNDQSADPCKFTLSFANETLIMAQASHGVVHGEEAATVVNAFFTRMSEVQKTARKPVSFATNEYAVQSVRIRDMRFCFGNIELTLSVVQGLGEGKPESSVTFSEMLYGPTVPCSDKNNK